MANVTRPYTADEVDRILGATPDPLLKAWIAIAAFAGPRASEICQVRTSDVDLERSTIYVPAEHVKGKYAEYIIYLTALTRHYVAVAMVLRTSTSKYVFSNRYRGRWDRVYVWRLIKALVTELRILKNEIGVPALHSFRKTFALAVYEATGFNLKAVKDVLHHGYLSSTLCYLPTDVRSLMDAM